LVVFSGEVSEAQKQELEQNRVTIKQQQAELIELRQQLAKLSEIVDRQTDDMKQLNIEARFVS
jgi:TPP-dependent 2-oxoacid decarboxylase